MPVSGMGAGQTDSKNACVRHGQLHHVCCLHCSACLVPVEWTCPVTHICAAQLPQIPSMLRPTLDSGTSLPRSGPASGTRASRGSSSSCLPTLTSFASVASSRRRASMWRWLPSTKTRGEAGVEADEQGKR